MYLAWSLFPLLPTANCQLLYMQLAVILYNKAQTQLDSNSSIQYFKLFQKNLRVYINSVNHISNGKIAYCEMKLKLDAISLTLYLFGLLSMHEIFPATANFKM